MYTITSSRAIQEFEQFRKIGKKNNSGNVILRCTLSIVRTQLTLIGPMLYYMHVTGASIAPKQSCALM